MRKLVFAILVVFLMVGQSWAAGSCTVAMGDVTAHTAEIIWTCTGDAADGSIPNSSALQYSSWLAKFPYTLSIVIENLAADANVTNDSDVYLYDKLSGGSDILEGDGVDQLDDSTRNFIRLTPNPVGKQVWVGVANQSGASGKYYITLTITE